MAKITTYSSPSHEQISLTPTQERMLTRAGVWPRDSRGEEMCQVAHGLHAGEPSLTDAELRAKYIDA